MSAWSGRGVAAGSVLTALDLAPGFASHAVVMAVVDVATAVIGAVKRGQRICSVLLGRCSHGGTSYVWMEGPQPDLL